MTRTSVLDGAMLSGDPAPARRRGGKVSRSLALLCALGAGAACAQSYTFLDQISSTSSTQFREPLGVGVDPSSRVIVMADASGHVELFHPDGSALSQFGAPGVGNGQFNEPEGVANDPISHNIVVADYGNDRVQIFNSSGAYAGQFGSPGSGTGNFTGPVGVAIDPADLNIVVTDFGNNRVEVFSSTGAYLNQFGSSGNGNGQFSGPAGIAIDAAMRRVVVVDNRNNRVQVFDSQGHYLFQFGTAGNLDGQFSGPEWVAVDPFSSDIAVSDSGNNRVEIFDSSGNYLGQLGTSGTNNGQFTAPSGIAIDPLVRNLVVADSGGDRVQIFALTLDVIEYYDAHDDLYFITATPAEAAALDSGAANLGPSAWLRTGYSFNAYSSPGAGIDACRFYNPLVPPVGSHFYTALPAECAFVRANLPSWIYESAHPFSVPLPEAGSCASGLIPVYRYFDNRAGANWRLVADPSVAGPMLAKGWVAEGVQMCSPR